MDFDFNQEQIMFQKSVRDFLEENCGPSWRRGLLEGKDTAGELWRRLAELGIFSILVPEEHGGLGLSLIDVTLVVEEFGRAPVPTAAIETLAATHVLARHGTGEQKARVLPLIAEGSVRVANALTEAAAGFDIDDISVFARPVEGGWRLNGQKILVSGASASGYLLVGLRFGEGGEPGLALIDSKRSGISMRRHDALDLTGPQDEVTFTDVAIATGDIVGGAPLRAALEDLLDTGSTLAATQLTGIASRVLDDAVAYAGQRTQFGKPIGSFQAIKHRCADMAVQTDTSRSAAYYAAWALAEGSPDRARAVSIAKSYCGDAARFVCNEGIQVHGGIGFTWELGLHLYLRQAKTLELTYGGSDWHRERVMVETLNQLNIGS